MWESGDSMNTQTELGNLKWQKTNQGSKLFFIKRGGVFFIKAYCQSWVNMASVQRVLFPSGHQRGQPSPAQWCPHHHCQWRQWLQLIGPFVAAWWTSLRFLHPSASSWWRWPQLLQDSKTPLPPLQIRWSWGRRPLLELVEITGYKSSSDYKQLTATAKDPIGFIRLLFNDITLTSYIINVYFQADL